ncbi:hypothetical protein CF124_03035 [Aeromonas hydrophila]|nr:hypothetical protein CF124_03035 [Aeromonas hydrophila]
MLLLSVNLKHYWMLLRLILKPSSLYVMLLHWRQYVLPEAFLLSILNWVHCVDHYIVRRAMSIFAVSMATLSQHNAIPSAMIGNCHSQHESYCIFS